MRKILNYIFWPALAGLVFAVLVLQGPALLQAVPTLESLLTRQGSASSHRLSFSEAIRIAAPGVVSISSQQVVPRFVEEYANPFARPTLRPIYEGGNSLGSGVVISPDGYIITSYHLLFNPATGFPPVDNLITLGDGRILEARVVKLDEENDLALLKVDAEGLPALDVADIEELEVGDIVLAIGNPRNIGQSVSLGIVSAFVRKGDSYVVQTDAAINPGNSGGALIDIHGKLVGINSTIISDSGGSEGIGFATPAQKAFALMNTYIEGGPSGYLGIAVDVHDTTLSFIISERQLADSQESVRGIFITRVAANGPADRAGIRTGDLLTAINETKITNPEEALAAFNFIGANSPGDLISIEVFRNGELHTMRVVLGVGEPNLTLELKEDAGIGDLPPGLLQ